MDVVDKFEFYYDSTEEDPQEDPDEIRERIERIAADRGIECEFVDVADIDGDEWAERRDALRASVVPEREYDVGRRVFVEGTFGRFRPVLAIRYDDADGIDLYPHRRDDVSSVPIGVTDFLDEVEDGETTDRGDFADIADTVDARSREESEADDRRRPSGADDRETAESQSESDSDRETWASSVPVSRRAVVAGVAGTAGAVGVGAVVGVKNVPVVGALVDCGPGETKVEEITNGGMVGSTVDIRGKVDYALDDEAGFTAFRLDGQTGTVPVYFAAEPDVDIGFGECLHVRGTVASGEQRPVDGPVVADATIVTA